MTRLLPLPLSILLCLCWGADADAQQFAQSSLYWLDPVQFNPAYAGLDNSLSITGTYRSQWTGLEGQPTGQTVSAHLPLYIIGSGLGVDAARDDLGARTLSRFGISYSYQIVRPTAVWSIGVNARMTSLNINGGDLRTPDGNYENVVVHNDNLLPTSTVDNSGMAFGAGVFYQAENLEGGLSVRNVNNATIGFEGFDYRLQQQYHAYLRARLDVLGDFTVSPMLHGYSDGTQHQLSVGGYLQYDENFFAGAAYRGYNSNTADAIALFGGLNLSDNISVAYAYDLTLSDLKTVNDGSHEITLKYNLNKRIGAGVPPPVIYNPRAKE